MLPLALCIDEDRQSFPRSGTVGSVPQLARQLQVLHEQRAGAPMIRF